MGMKPRPRLHRPAQVCTQPDRHEPKLKCGYPMPCPHHTVLVVVREPPESKPSVGCMYCAKDATLPTDDPRVCSGECAVKELYDRTHDFKWCPTHLTWWDPAEVGGDECPDCESDLELSG